MRSSAAGRRLVRKTSASATSWWARSRPRSLERSRRDGALASVVQLEHRVGRQVTAEDVEKGPARVAFGRLDLHHVGAPVGHDAPRRRDRPPRPRARRPGCRSVARSCSRGVGVKRTGMDSRPLTKLEGRYSSAAASASARSGRRVRTSRNITRSSRRARAAPRQKWVPNPKARCGLGSRRMSSSSGPREHVVVTIGRRVEEHQLVALGAAAGPRNSTSRVAVRAMFLTGDTQRSSSSTATGNSPDPPPVRPAHPDARAGRPCRR